jgi:hypothetical protein
MPSQNFTGGNRDLFNFAHFLRENAIVRWVKFRGEGHGGVARRPAWSGESEVHIGTRKKQTQILRSPPPNRKTFGAPFTPDERGDLNVVVSHPFGRDHPTDEDLFAGAPEANGWGTELWWRNWKPFHPSRAVTDGGH